MTAPSPTMEPLAPSVSAPVPASAPGTTSGRWRLLQVQPKVEAVKAKLQPTVEAVKANVVPAAEVVRSRVAPAVAAVKSRVHPAVVAVQSRMHPTVTSVRSFTRLLNELVRPEVVDKTPDTEDGRHDWFEAYNCCPSSNRCFGAFKCCGPHVNKTAVSVALLIFVGLIISLVSLIEVSGHPPRAMSSSSGNGGGGEGSDGGVGSDGGSDGGGGSSYPGTPYDNLGICYGRLGNNLPPASEVVTLLQSLGVGLVRIYDSDATVLEAFANTQIKVLAGVPNEELKSLASGSGVAKTWLQKYIVPFPNTKIPAISVGNEILLASPGLAPYLVPAMKNLQKALESLGLDLKIKLSSTMPLNVLADSYPPSAGAFRSDFSKSVIKPYLDFLSSTNSFFMLNVYPYFAYRDNLDVISFEYAVFRPNPGVVDSQTGLQYTNLLDAQLDAVITAMGRLGHKSDIPLVVTETGWPSKGDSNEAGASLANAAAYNKNLVSHVLSRQGTPMRPQEPITAYIFALFNENSKPGATSERNFGLFWPNKERVYGIDVPLGGGGETGNGGQGEGGDGSQSVSSGEVPSPGRNWIHSVQGVGRRLQP